VTALNFEKAASQGRAAGLHGLRPGDGAVTTTLEDVERILHPEARRCRRCPGLFSTTGEEVRPRPIHLCPRCRLDVEEECEINGLPTTLLDDRLTQALADIAQIEGRIVRAERRDSPGGCRRAMRLRARIAAIRTDLDHEATIREAA
jgi:hypothetical protein